MTEDRGQNICFLTSEDIGEREKMKKKWIVSVLLLSMVYGLWINDAECNIILKSLVVNPSKTQTQKALLKAYLPKEAKPEDIVDLGDLKIDYDITKALYYVYKEFELTPGESAARSVEIRDVWIMSKAKIEALSGQAKELVKKLKKTVSFETAVVLQKDIEAKSAEILNKQENAADVLPQTHIAVYRENVKTLNSIKNNLAKLDEMLLKVELAAPGGARERASVRAAWRVIIAVIISLGLLSLILYIIWHRQAVIVVERKEKEKAKESRQG